MLHQTDVGRHSSKRVLLLSSLALSGCGILNAVGIVNDAPEPPPLPISQIPYTVELTINTGTDANPGADRRPSPVRVRLFLTEPDKDLLSQPFETIFEFGENRPAIDPAAVIVLSPGENRTVQLNGMKSQNQLVVAAAFHDVYSTVWIANKIIDTDKPGSNTLAIGARSIEIE